MNKEMKVSDNDHQTNSELAQSGSIDADAGKMTWHSPKFRALKVSQETNAACGGSNPCT